MLKYVFNSVAESSLVGVFMYVYQEANGRYSFTLFTIINQVEVDVVVTVTFTIFKIMKEAGIYWRYI